MAKTPFPKARNLWVSRETRIRPRAPPWRIFAIYPIFHGYWILRGVWKIGWGDFQACATFSFLGIRFHVLGPQALIANEPVTPLVV